MTKEDGVYHLLSLDVKEQMTPDGIASLVPGSLEMSSRGRGWDKVVLQRYQLRSGEIDLPPTRDNLLFVFLEGRALIEARQDNGYFERRWCDGNQISIKPADQSVRKSLRGQCKALVIHISPLIFEEVADDVYGSAVMDLALLLRFVRPDHIVEQLARLLLEEAETGDVGTALGAGFLVRSLTMQILRRHSSLAPRLPKAPTAMPVRHLEGVIEHMKSYPEKPLTLADLSGVVGLSQSHFARAFRQSTSESPHRYLTRLRMERARDLLENSRSSITDIATQCGFVRPAHFASTFHKASGMSPRAWRIACR